MKPKSSQIQLFLWSCIQTFENHLSSTPWVIFCFINFLAYPNNITVHHLHSEHFFDISLDKIYIQKKILFEYFFILSLFVEFVVVYNVVTVGIKEKVANNWNDKTAVFRLTRLNVIKLGHMYVNSFIWYVNLINNPQNSVM